MAVSTDGVQVVQEGVQEPLRTVLVGQRYEYRLQEEQGRYFVWCRDIERAKNSLKHGPFTLSQAHAMIDARIARDESLKR